MTLIASSRAWVRAHPFIVGTLLCVVLGVVSGPLLELAFVTLPRWFSLEGLAATAWLWFGVTVLRTARQTFRELKEGGRED